MLSGSASLGLECVAGGNYIIGAWRSLVARSVRDAEVGGSNPLAPTTIHHPLAEIHRDFAGRIQTVVVPVLTRAYRRLR